MAYMNTKQFNDVVIPVLFGALVRIFSFIVCFPGCLSFERGFVILIVEPSLKYVFSHEKRKDR